VDGVGDFAAENFVPLLRERAHLRADNVVAVGPAHVGLVGVLSDVVEIMHVELFAQVGPHLRHRPGRVGGQVFCMHEMQAAPESRSGLMQALNGDADRRCREPALDAFLNGRPHCRVGFLRAVERTGMFAPFLFERAEHAANVAHRHENLGVGPELEGLVEVPDPRAALIHDHGPVGETVKSVLGSGTAEVVKHRLHRLATDGFLFLGFKHPTGDVADLVKRARGGGVDSRILSEQVAEQCRAGARQAGDEVEFLGHKLNEVFDDGDPGFAADGLACACRPSAVRCAGVDGGDAGGREAVSCCVDDCFGDVALDVGNAGAAAERAVANRRDGVGDDQAAKPYAALERAAANRRDGVRDRQGTSEAGAEVKREAPDSRDGVRDGQGTSEAGAAAERVAPDARDGVGDG
jgi:hypothetical protein